MKSTGAPSRTVVSWGLSHASCGKWVENA
jgi:hypothetical protein